MAALLIHGLHNASTAQGKQSVCNAKFPLDMQVSSERAVSSSDCHEEAMQMH